jgi:hypothetical protein
VRGVLDELPEEALPRPLRDALIRLTSLRDQIERAGYRSTRSAVSTRAARASALARPTSAASSRPGLNGDRVDLWALGLAAAASCFRRDVGVVASLSDAEIVSRAPLAR